MLPHPFAMFGKVSPENASVRVGYGTRHQDAGAGALPRPPTATVGDMLVVLGGGPSGGAGAAYSVVGNAYCRALQSGDFTANIILPAPCAWAIYRGPFSMALRGSASAPGGSALNVPGFTKANNCAGLLMCGQADADATAGPGVGPPWTNLGASGAQAHGPYFGISDLLNPALYVNGSTVAGGGSSNGTTTFYLLEMLY